MCILTIFDSCQSKVIQLVFKSQSFSPFSPFSLHLPFSLFSFLSSFSLSLLSFFLSLIRFTLSQVIFPDLPSPELRVSIVTHTRLRLEERLHAEQFDMVLMQIVGMTITETPLVSMKYWSQSFRIFWFSFLDYLKGKVPELSMHIRMPVTSSNIEFYNIILAVVKSNILGVFSLRIQCIRP